jgi:hypothetical protein
MSSCIAYVGNAQIIFIILKAFFVLAYAKYSYMDSEHEGKQS